MTLSAIMAGMRPRTPVRAAEPPTPARPVPAWTPSPLPGDRLSLSPRAVQAARGSGAPAQAAWDLSELASLVAEVERAIAALEALSASPAIEPIMEPVTEAPAEAPVYDEPPATGPGDPMGYFFSQFRHERFNPTGPSRSSNCGPASLAMALKAFGLTPPGLSDPGDVEQYIDKTRRAMTGNEDDGAYTNTSQVAQGARAAGANAEAVSGLAGAEQALAEGKLVVAAGNPAAYQGRFSGAEMAKYDGGHFILVAGRDADGNYMINDPLSRIGTVTVSPDELRGYLGYQGWNAAVAVWP
jgi:hypothetical protein